MQQQQRRRRKQSNPGIQKGALCFDLTGRFVTFIKADLASNYANFSSSYSVPFLCCWSLTTRRKVLFLIKLDLLLFERLPRKITGSRVKSIPPSKWMTLVWFCPLVDLPYLPAKQAGVLMKAFFSFLYSTNIGSYCHIRNSRQLWLKDVTCLGNWIWQGFAESSSLLSSSSSSSSSL